MVSLRDELWKLITASYHNSLSRFDTAFYPTLHQQLANTHQPPKISTYIKRVDPIYKKAYPEDNNR